jgi:hypothetical protein
VWYYPPRPCLDKTNFSDRECDAYSYFEERLRHQPKHTQMLKMRKLTGRVCYPPIRLTCRGEGLGPGTVNVVRDARDVAVA